MSKELTPLEALERIKEFYPQWQLYNRKDFALIETALKGILKLEKENEQLVEDYQSLGSIYVRDMNEKEKQLKELEIIKEKLQIQFVDGGETCDSGTLFVVNSDNEWVEICNIPKNTPEFDLLKEVLL